MEFNIMARHHVAEYIVISELITFDFLLKCYNVADGFDLEKSLMIYDIFKKEFEKDIKNFENSKVESVDDIYSLGSPQKVIIRNYIRERLKFAIDTILLPCLNLNFCRTNLPTIPNCFSFVVDSKLIIGTSKENIFSNSWRTDPGFINLNLLKRFIIENDYDRPMEA